MNYKSTSELRPHPENNKIYGDNADSELVTSVEKKGIINPLLITQDGRVINGHRRLDAAIKIGLSQVPVIVSQMTNELDILEALIESNRQRIKTNEQIGREAKSLLVIEQERMAIRKSIALKEGVKVVIPAEQPRDSYNSVASKIGKGKSFVHETVRVVEAIDTLEERGRDLEANELRTTLNKSAKRAYQVAKDDGLIQVQQRKEEPKVQDNLSTQSYISLEDYKLLSEIEQDEILSNPENTGKKFNNQSTANIEWAQWSWNPVTGCKHDCPYCYARDIANRFYPTKFEPTLWADRLFAPMNTKVPKQAEHDIGAKNVFTCSMSDLFGRWIPTEWIEAVLQTVADNPQWNFLFLTKFPIRMAEFEYPDNAWMGTSVDCQIRVKPVEKAFAGVKAKVKWLSCEPMIEPLKFNSLDMFQWVVIGGASKSTQTPAWTPPRQWVHDLEVQAHNAGCMVYEKSNLQPIERLCEYPFNVNETGREAPSALRYLPMVETV